MRIIEINGDKQNSTLEKFFIFIQIFIDLLLESKVRKQTEYKINLLKLDEINDKKLLSPSRIACTNYLINYLNNFFQDKTINLIDFGCGDGKYYNIFNKILETKIDNYLGIDVRKNENHRIIKKNVNVNFLIAKVEDEKNLEIDFKPSLIFSHSVLEHIKDDLKVIDILLQKFPKVKQLHLLPASISGINYLAHGYRRYNFNELKSICKKRNLKFLISPIGGKNCMIDYFQWSKVQTGEIHPLERFFKSNKKYYSDDIEKYCNIGKNEFPIFYALEIN